MNELPGGILDDGRLERTYRFRPVDGRLEMAILEAVRCEDRFPQVVTRVLASALDRVGNRPSDEELVRHLSVGDRRFLARDLSLHLGWFYPWRTFLCARCGERFDVRIDAGSLPVKPAGTGYPHCDVRLPFGVFRFRVPSGDDQERLAALEDSPDEDDDAAAAERLIEFCLVETLDGTWDRTRAATGVDVIERAMENAAPDVADRAQATCPSCGFVNTLELDPYECLRTDRADPLDDVHCIASTYHWSEADILSLPRERRLEYLRRIDRDRGRFD